MALLVADRGLLRTALEQALSHAGKAPLVAEPGEDDLFERALNQEAVLYLPSASLLDGKLDPVPSPRRISGVLSASNAPGVRLLVAVIPEGQGYEPELDAIRRFGTPYVILEAAPLLEELGEALGEHAPRSLWLPARGQAQATTAQAVARAAIDAMESEQQGRVIRVEAETLGPAALVRRVAEHTGIRVRVRRLWLWTYRLAGRLRRWLTSRLPCHRVLLERLFPELGSAGSAAISRGKSLPGASA